VREAGNKAAIRVAAMHITMSIAMALMSWHELKFLIFFHGEPGHNEAPWTTHQTSPFEMETRQLVVENYGKK